MKWQIINISLELVPAVAIPANTKLVADVKFKFRSKYIELSLKSGNDDALIDLKDFIFFITTRMFLFTITLSSRSLYTKE